MSEIDPEIETGVGTDTGTETGTETGPAAVIVISNRNQALQEWLADSPYATDLFFNFAPTEAGTTAVAPISGESVIKRYLGGYALKAYEFGVIQYIPVNMDVPNNSENADAMYSVEQFMEWVKEQNAARNFPDFEDCDVQRVEVLNNMPVVAGQDDEVAKYMFQCRVTYIEKEL